MIEVLGTMWPIVVVTFVVMTAVTLAALLRRPRWGAPRSADTNSSPVDPAPTSEG